MTPDRAANNRVLAEFCGFRYVEDSEAGTPQWHSPDCKCEAAASQDECTCIESCYWVEGGPPDFYESEAANAMLRDVILARGYSMYVRTDRIHLFKGIMFDTDQEVGEFPGEPITAICNAALALINQEKC